MGIGTVHDVYVVGAAKTRWPVMMPTHCFVVINVSLDVSG